jgi:hypothetical protein
MKGRTGEGIPADTVFGIEGTGTTFYRLTISDTTVFNSDVTVSDQLTVTSGDILWAKSSIITLLGTGTSPISVAGTFKYGTSTISYAADNAQSIVPMEYYNLTTTSASAFTKTASGRVTIWGVLTIDGASTFAAGSSTIALAGTASADPMAVNGTFDYGTSTVRYCAAASQNVVPVDYYNLWLGRPDGSLTSQERYAAGSFSVYGTLTTDTCAAFNIYGHTISVQRDVTAVGYGSTSSSYAGRNVWRAGATLRFFGSGPSVFLQNAWNPGECDANDFLLEKDSRLDTVYVSIPGTSGVVFGVRDSGSVTISRGILDMLGNYMCPYPNGYSTGTFTLGSEGTIRCGGYNNFPLNSLSSGYPTAYFTSYNLQTGSNVEYYMLGAQVIRANATTWSAIQYSNIRLLGSGKKSMQRNTTSSINMIVNDTLTLASGTSFGRMGTMTSLRYAGTGVLQYMHSWTPALQALQTTSDSEFVTGTYAPQNLSIFNNHDVKLGASKSLSGDVSFICGKMVLGLRDLDLTKTTYPIVDADTARFFVTDTTYTTTQLGWLHLYCVNSSSYTTFPIGAVCSRNGSAWGSDTSYNPIMMRRVSGSEKGYKARVSSWIIRNVSDREAYVKREWTALEDGTDSTDMYVQLGWNPADEGVHFDEANAFIETYHGTGANEWQVPGSSGAVGSDPILIEGFLNESSGIARMKSNFRLNIGSAAVWPAGIISIDAARKSSDVVLTWRTASEYENAGFSVERSIDGGNWEAIGWVPGYGTTTETSEYLFTDVGIDRLRPVMVSYRVRQVDVDGGSHTSPVVLVSMGEMPASPCITGVFPNPVTTETNVTFATPPEAGRITIALCNALGVEVVRLVDENNLDPGSHLVNLSATGLPAGLYYLSLTHSRGRELRKVVIRR